MPREALFMSIYRKREFKLFENISRSQGGPMGGFSEEVTSQFVTCIRECDLSASRVGGVAKSPKRYKALQRAAYR